MRRLDRSTLGGVLMGTMKEAAAFPASFASISGKYLAAFPDLRS